MKAEIKKSFENDVKKIKDKKLLKQIHAAIEDIISAKNLLDIQNLKKLKGYKESYRLRIGSYRVGIKHIDDTIYLVRFLSRKDIYKYFP